MEDCPSGGRKPRSSWGRKQRTEGRPSVEGSEVRIQAPSGSSISGSAIRAGRQGDMDGDDDTCIIHWPEISRGLTVSQQVMKITEGWTEN